MGQYYDCIVIGGGHAAIEAALASSKMGRKTLMMNLSFHTIGQMSCNPAIGGVGKGQLVKEIDALGGAMGVVTDRSAIQFRQLNASKGQAVRSSRCQADSALYRKGMQEMVSQQKDLDFFKGKAGEILLKGREVVGLKTEDGEEFKCKVIVMAAGTFLHGKIHVGKKIVPGGRIGESNSVALADSLSDLGFRILFFKTGTPPRLDRKTINFSGLSIQNSDPSPIPFSYRTKSISSDQQLLPCFITNTNEKVHKIISDNMHLSPMYSGQMEATGVRYCPSIEDKLKKFPHKKSHQIFLEPEGLNTDFYYPNGISTGLPQEVQETFVHQIKGLENVKILRYGYSIEHGIIHPTELKPSLETKKIGGLFFAGQVNGSTGYEEAAAQGIMAGINAALKVKEKPPFILGRDESYIGVLLDDLVTKGTEEPYRMFTSRVEYRLIVREDNADLRLSKYGYALGLISREHHQSVEDKYRKVKECLHYLKSRRVAPCDKVNEKLISWNSSAIKQSVLLSDLLKRPEIDYQRILSIDSSLKDVSWDVILQIEYEVKYEGFIARQLKNIERFRHLENIKIPAEIRYDEIPSLSKEISQKLKEASPFTLGQANRISGVTPAAISILMVYIRKIKKSK